MPVKRIMSDMDVVTAAKIRIRNVFRNGLPVYMSFSGGKDSLCLANLTYSLIRAGEIDARQLTVIFVDEEAIFPCIEETVKRWRELFLLASAKFDWLCIEVRHFNCFNALTSDESYICWDETRKDVWVRQPPPYAIRTHPLLKAREDTYQTFLPRATKAGLMLIGVRAAESVQRLQYMATMNMGAKDATTKQKIFPIYDWKNSDVWLYLRRENVEIPDIYLNMWQAGIGKSQLRVSQFFSVDTAACLVRMNEYYPDLMERVIRREPNAYLAALYWDSEMFGRSTSTRRKLEGEEQKDYRALLKEMLLLNPYKYFDTEHKRYVAHCYRRMFIKMDAMAQKDDYKDMYEGLIGGDPKQRTLRAIYKQVAAGYAEKAKRQKQGGAVHA